MKLKQTLLNSNMAYNNPIKGDKHYLKITQMFLHLRAAHSTQSHQEMRKETGITCTCPPL